MSLRDSRPAARPRPRVFALTLLFSAVAVLTACSGSTDSPSTPLADSAVPKFSETPPEGGSNEPLPEKRPLDAGYSFEGSALRADRFVANVVRFEAGPCAGFGQSAMPDVVFGPPHGAGDGQGGYDVVSLGVGGEIVLGFDNAIVDAPGDDFTVFENSFFAGGNVTRPAADLGEVSVSEDGNDWKTFPCTATEYPYGACAGWRPVYANRENGISPVTPEAGGDRYDLAAVGLSKARFVRIRDMRSSECPGNLPVINLGFDLDAIVILNAERP